MSITQQKERIKRLTTTDMYGYYKNNYNNPVDNVTFINICRLFNKKIANAIIKESFEFKMPYRLGILRIKAGKQKIFIKDGKLDTRKMRVDWNATNKMWKNMYPDMTLKEIYENISDKQLVFHTNEHNNGYINRFYWDKRLVNIPNNTAYVFKPVKGGITEDGYYCGKRGLASWIKDDEKINEYYQ